MTAIIAGLAWVLWRAVTNFNYEWNWADTFERLTQPNEKYGGLSFFIFSIINTLKIAFWVCVFASGIGFIGGLARNSRSNTLRFLSMAYVGFIRNIPPLVSLFIFYFFIAAQLTPLLPLDSMREILSSNTALQWLIAEPSLLENMLAGIIALSIIEGAFITEIVRGGLKAIPQGQTEAARSLGMTPLQALRHIQIPQLLRIIRLPLGNTAVSILKNTAILSLISVQDLAFAAQELANSSGRVFEIWILTAAVYLILCWTLDFALKRLFAKRNE